MKDNKKKNRIFDCFTFYNEIELLDLRLNVLNDYVDNFVLVEATKTQKGEEKELFYEKNKHLFEKFNNKIIHVVLSEYPNELTQWTIENIQRNTIMQGLKNCQDDDIILISDLDEIPKPEFIKKYYDRNKIIAFDMNCFYFYLNLYSYNRTWRQGTKMLSYSNLKNILNEVDFVNSNESKYLDLKYNNNTTPCKIRLYNGDLQKHVKNAGWHFSYMGGVKKAVQKIQSICEGSLDTKSTDIINMINNKIFYEQILLPVKIDNNFPKYLLKNQEKFTSFIYNKQRRRFWNLYFLKALFKVSKIINLPNEIAEILNKIELKNEDNIK